MQKTPEELHASLSRAISVILVSWNSELHLTGCLQALAVQKFQDFEIVMLDNGSTNGLNIDLPKNCAILEKLDANLGFAVANNIGARLARGEWLVLLNADAYPEPDWLENLLRAAEQNPEYNFFSSRQIQY
ncbi:MAG: glycosyltransferase family 2 protein, partial [Candidatus Brocadia sp.]|nr:glycosyltransferase family 2 protein [Candidatus Brocadia sp.]